MSDNPTNYSLIFSLRNMVCAVIFYFSVKKNRNVGKLTKSSKVTELNYPGAVFLKM